LTVGAIDRSRAACRLPQPGSGDESGRRRSRKAVYRTAACPPEPTYYILTDFSEISDLESREFAVWLAKEVGVATVPGMSFYSRPELGKSVTRFAFCKKLETLEKAAERLVGVQAKV